MLAIFLLPNGTFIFELVIFIVVLGVVAKFILPPIQGALDQRAATIRESQRVSDEGQAEAEHLVNERRRILEQARAESRLLFEQAGRAVEELRAEARGRALVEHDAFLSSSQATMAAERQRVRAEAISRLGEIVIAAASQVIGSPIEPARHDEVIARAIADASSTAGS